MTRYRVHLRSAPSATASYEVRVDVTATSLAQVFDAAVRQVEHLFPERTTRDAWRLIAVEVRT
jgi:hypothetical protein